MLRAIRFAVQLNMVIATDTLLSIKKNAHRISIISQERISTELNKILMAHTPSIGFKLLDSTCLLNIIFPELTNMKHVDVLDNYSHKDNFLHTLEVVDNIAKISDNLWLRWAGLLHDIAKPKTKKFDPIVGFTFHGHEELGARMVPKIFKKFKLPLDSQMNYVQKLVRMHLRPIALAKEGVSDSAIRRIIYEAGNDIDDLLALCRSDITSKNEQKVNEYMNNFLLVEKKIQAVEEKDHIKNFQPVIDGKLIMQTFGLQPCRVVGEIKDELKEAVLDGKIKNEFDVAFKFMLELGIAKGLFCNVKHV